jgi:hypothetical protein
MNRRKFISQLLTTVSVTGLSAYALHSFEWDRLRSARVGKSGISVEFYPPKNLPGITAAAAITLEGVTCHAVGTVSTPPVTVPT